MILTRFIVGFILLFVFPFVYVSIKYKDLKPSLALSFGLIASFSFAWVLFLVSFLLKLNGVHLLWLLCLFYGFLFLQLYFDPSMKKEGLAQSEEENGGIDLLILAAVFIILIPMFAQAGTIFNSSDAVISWNRWAMEMSRNVYNTVHGAYPVFFPAVWSLLYKIQGTPEIWWTVKLSLFVTPVILISLLLNLFIETKSIVFLFVCCFAAPYLSIPSAVNGFMDVPAMLLGLLSLAMLKASELSRDDRERRLFISAALLMAGISSIIKQAGLAFLLFNFIYIILAYPKELRNKFLWFFFAVSLAYFLSFLFLYYQHDGGVFIMLNYLRELSCPMPTHLGKEVLDYALKLKEIFLFPENSFWGLRLSSGHLFMGFLIIAGLLSFKKEKRRNEPIGYLSMIFFFVGFAIWAVCFSYDFRNTFWVKAFLIISASVGLSSVNRNFIRYVILAGGVLLACAVPMLLRSDQFVYQQQEFFQKRFGNQNLARMVSGLLKGKPDCVVVVMSQEHTQYNYVLKEVFERIINRPTGPKDYLESYDNSSFRCSAGYYWVMKKTDVDQSSKSWQKFKELEARGKIKKVQEIKDYWAFFIRPENNQ